MMQDILLQHYAAQAAAAYKCYKMTQDTEDCVNFLLTLKNRSVTPDPGIEPDATSDDDQETPVAPLKREYSDSYDSDASPSLAEEQGSGAEIQVEPLVSRSDLVFPSDRDLVPDALFVAMAQMKACTLQEADRVGSYKARPIGFTGFCCTHCGGQAGFGRFFPNSVRSLAQTTTSQTILKHIGSKCRQCPPDVRKAVEELQQQQVLKESQSTGRPRYGSRKVFFQRIWSRLHDGDEPLIQPVTTAHTSTTPQHSDDETSSTVTAETLSECESSPKQTKRYGKFRILPTQKNLKRRMQPGGQPLKRQRNSNFYSI